MGEQPVMRSVALAPPLTALRSKHQHLPDIGALECPQRLKKLSINESKNGVYIPDKQQAVDSNLGELVKKEKAHVSNWAVANDSLSCVPDHYMLERTSCFIGETTASVIC